MKKLFALIPIMLILFASCGSYNDVDKKFNPTPYQFEFEIPNRDFIMYIPDDNKMTVEGVELGKKLFSETLLSSNNQISCTSCHDPKLAFASNNRFDRGFEGVKLSKNTMSLHNLVFNSVYSWKGKYNSLEKLIHDVILDPKEFNENWDNVILKLKDAGYSDMFFDAFGTQEFTADHVSKALAQYLRSNIAIDNKFVRAYYFNDPTAKFTPLEAMGFELFMNETGDCFHCHRIGTFASNRMSNNGLDSNPDLGYAAVTGSPADVGKFKIVSLLNIAVTPPYMHDGRFNTLEEVLDFYDGGPQYYPTIDPNILHLAPIVLTDDEKKAIIAFLHTLTDDRYLK